MSMAINTKSPIMDLAEAARHMKLSVHTVRKYIQRDLIKPAATIGGVHILTVEECERYNRERRKPGNPTFSRKPRRKRA